jgi:hypothetical protein
MIITVNYTAKWQLKNKPYYKWTFCKKLINCRTNREIKKTIKSGIVGYWIGKEFIKLSDLKTQIELIPKEKTPF